MSRRLIGRPEFSLEEEAIVRKIIFLRTRGHRLRRGLRFAWFKLPGITDSGPGRGEPSNCAVRKR